MMMTRGAAAQGIGRAVGLALVVCAAASSTGGALAEEEPSTFGTGVELITIDAVVVGDDGLSVRGLGADDFVVLDDGEVQTITSFEAVSAPPAPPARRTGEAPQAELMASTNQKPEPGSSRSFVIVYDAIHIGPTLVLQAKSAVSEFLRREIRPGDRVAAVATGSGAWWSAEIPTGRDDLLAFIEGQPSGLSAMNPLLDGMTAFEAERIGEHWDRRVHLRVLERWLGSGRCVDRCVEPQFDRIARGSTGGGSRGPQAECGAPCDVMKCNRHCTDLILGNAQMAHTQGRGKIAVTLETLERAMGELAQVRGRKSIVLVSEGFILDPGDDRYQRVIQVSLQANTAIYFLDVRGLQADLGVSDISEWGVPFGQAVSAGEQTTFATMGAQELAAGSGGFVIRNTNDLAAGMARISRESEAYYLLGYPPTNRPGKAGFRKIEVRVDRPGVEVRARQGYFVDEAGAVVRTVAPEVSTSDPKKRPALPPALDLRTDLPLRMAALVGPPADDERIHVRLVTEASLDSLRGAEKRREKLELQADVWPLNGTEWVRFDRRVEVPKGKASSNEAPSWLPIFHDMALPPGVYQARALLRDPDSERTGTVAHRFEVPEPRGLRLCSPVVSGSLERDGRGKPKLVPTAQRSFRLSTTPHLFIQFVVEGARNKNDVNALAALHDATGRAVRGVPREPVPAAGGRLTRMLGIGLDGLQPGAYELRIEARLETTGEECQHRERILLTP